MRYIDLYIPYETALPITTPGNRHAGGRGRGGAHARAHDEGGRIEGGVQPFRPGQFIKVHETPGACTASDWAADEVR